MHFVVVWKVSVLIAKSEEVVSFMFINKSLECSIKKKMIPLWYIFKTFHIKKNWSTIFNLPCTGYIEKNCII